jgi:ABC-type transport system involved in multi-copper enzyme maturation permease subunit
MIAAIRSEFRKLLTVRSTYVIIGFVLFIVILFAGLIQGYHADAGSLLNRTYLAGESSGGIIFGGLILAFGGLLLFGHEYRFNIIMYTLTSTNRRLKVLVAKLLVVSVFALVMSLVIIFFSPLCTIIGLHLHSYHLVPQTFNTWHIIGHCLFCGWGYAMYAFILVAILRNQISAIVTFLIVPLIGEEILTLLLKGNSRYLPFTSLQAVADPTTSRYPPSEHAALVALTYIVIGLIIGAVLFVRRDAN